jgi:hypothetical protein
MNERNMGQLRGTEENGSLRNTGLEPVRAAPTCQLMLLRGVLKMARKNTPGAQGCFSGDNCALIFNFPPGPAPGRFHVPYVPH